MTRKTWIKLKRGLLTDPKHRLDLGNCIWLYLYMLDITDWDTGKIMDWQDKTAADELQMPVGTVRYQRRKIEEADYISCLQLYQRQEITIKRWVNPREYSGKLYNNDDDGLDGIEELTPSGSVENDGVNDGGNDGGKHGGKHGGKKLTLLHYNHIPHITDHITDKELINDDHTFQKVWEEETGKPITAMQAFCAMVDEFEKAGVTPDDYRTAIREQSKSTYKMTSPTSVKQWALGIADLRRQPVKKNGHKAGGVIEYGDPSGGGWKALAEEQTMTRGELDA